MANGTIAFDTLSTSGQISGTAVSVDADYLAYGSAKVWYLASNAASLTDSFNVSSGSDGGTGNYTYNYSNAFANANYSVSGVCGEGSVFLVFNSSRATGSSNNKVGNTGGSVTDAQNTGQINGDLA